MDWTKPLYRVDLWVLNVRLAAQWSAKDLDRDSHGARLVFAGGTEERVRWRRRQFGSARRLDIAREGNTRPSLGRQAEQDLRGSKRETD